MKPFLKFLFAQHKTLGTIMYLLSIAGAVAFVTINREAFPAIDFRQIVITATYPGASTLEMENQVVNKIENALLKVEGNDRLLSLAKENVATTTFRILSDYPKKTSDVLSEIQNEITQITDFPPDMTDAPSVVEVKSSLFSVLKIMVSGGKTPEELYTYVDGVRDALEDLSNVYSVNLDGFPNKEIWVNLNLKKLNDKDGNILDVRDSIAAKNLDLPAGTVDINDETYTLSAKGQYKDLDGIKQTYLRVNDVGNSTRVSDVANVEWSRERQESRMYTDDKLSVSMSVLKNENSDIIKTVNQVKGAMEKLKNSDFQFHYYGDESAMVQQRLEILSSSAFSGAFLIFLCLIFFFDFWSTFWASLSIPVSACMGFAIAALTGDTLNMMTMFAFIVVIGMVIDNAILVIVNVYNKLSEGGTPEDAVVDGVAEVMLPVVASASTTIAAFLPIYLIKTFVGKFLSYIPSIVSYTIVASLFFSLFYIPTRILENFNKRKRKLDKKGLPFVIKEKGLWLNAVIRKYKSILEFLLAYPKRMLSIMILISIVILGAFVVFVPKEFFGGQLRSAYVNLEFRPNQSLEETQKKLHELEQQFKEKFSTDLVQIYTYTGVWKGQENDKMRDKVRPYMGSLFVEFNINKKSIDADVPRMINDIVEANRESLDIVKNDFTLNLTGPPAGASISLNLLGDKLETMLPVIDEIETLMKGIPNVVNVASSYELGTDELRLQFDDGKASALGVDLSSAAVSLRSAFNGIQSTTANYLYKDPVDVIVKYDEGYHVLADKKSMFEILNNFEVRNDKGNHVKLSSFATFSLGQSIESIAHRDRLINVEIDGDLKDYNNKVYTSQKVNELFEQKIGDVRKKYPNITFASGGEKETNQDLTPSLMLALAVAVFLIFVVLTSLFKSYLQTFVIMSVIPLGFVGVSAGLLLHYAISFFIPMDKVYYTFNFMVSLGLVALGGVLVNNSIVMVSIINNLRAKGMQLKEAVLEGTVSRFKPIFLTTATALIGLIPFSYGFEGKDTFLQPMGLALVWGILLGTCVTLGFVPIIYLLMERTVARIYKKMGRDIKLTTID